MNGSGQSHRAPVGLVQVLDMFPDEAAAREWCETARWGGKPTCPHCRSAGRVQPVPGATPMPYHCGACRKYFSVMTGTVMQSSKLPLRTWVIGIHLMSTSLRGGSPKELHRDLGVTRKTAWLLTQKIREGWLRGTRAPMNRAIEAGGERLAPMEGR